MTTKAIINGKRYDTETATLIASYRNTRDVRDFRHFSEDLYKTAKGEYFLSGEGGPLSEYCHREGSTSYGSSKIVQMTADEARIWLEKYQEVEALEEEFGKDIIDA